MIADSHCHLDYPHLFDQLTDVVKRAENNQVKYFLTICTTLESFEKIPNHIANRGWRDAGHVQDSLMYCYYNAVDPHQPVFHSCSVPGPSKTLFRQEIESPFLAYA